MDVYLYYEFETGTVLSEPEKPTREMCTDQCGKETRYRVCSCVPAISFICRANVQEMPIKNYLREVSDSNFRQQVVSDKDVVR